MEALWKKLNWKGFPQTTILNAPPEFQPAIDFIKHKSEVVIGNHCPQNTPFLIAFAENKSILLALARVVIPAINEQSVVWFCYPKGTSKKYKSDINRDKGWELFGAANMEPVRQVAIDDDWSALRFKPVSTIKSLTRNESMMLSRAGLDKKQDKS